MTTRKRPPFHLQSENIQRWQISTCENGEIALPTATISALYNGIVGFLKVVTDNVRKNEPCPSYFSTLEQAVAVLFFWGRDFGVPQGELDTALQFSNRLRDTVLTVLASLGDLSSLGLIRIIATDAERKALLRTTRLVSLTEDAKLLLDEPPEPASYEEENIDRLCGTLHNMIDSLKILGSSLDFVADDEFDDEESKVWNQLQDRAAHEYFVDLISSRFPLASNQLVQALGQSNWDRYNYVKTLRESAIEESGVISGEKAISEFHDSGIGTSAVAQSSLGRETRSEYAATVVSSRAESSHKRLPPLPEAGRSGEAFECEVCNRKVQIQRTREWKKHVFEDICAYTCVFPECSSSRVLFKDRKAMTHHLASHHNIPDTPRAHSCPLCLEEIVGDRDIISMHFARHMEEIALGILPQSTDSDDDSEQSDDDELEMLLSTSPGVGHLDVLIEPSAGVALATENPSPNLDSQDHLANGSDSDHDQAQDFEVSDSEEGYFIACICDSEEDDGNIVLCEECKTWQHIHCLYKSTQSVPDVHLCLDCVPREIYPTLIKDIRQRHMEQEIERRHRPRLRIKPNKASRASKVGDNVSRLSENSGQSVDRFVPLATYTSTASAASLPPLSKSNVPSSANPEKDTASNSRGEPTTEQRILRNVSQLLDSSAKAQKRAHPCVQCFNIHVDCDKGYPSCGGCIARNLECLPRASGPKTEETKYGAPVLPNEDKYKTLKSFGEIDFTHRDHMLLADLRDDENLTQEQIAEIFPGRDPEVLLSFYRDRFAVTKKIFETLDPILSLEQHFEQTDQLPSMGELVSKQELPSIREAQVMAEMQQGVQLPPFHQMFPEYGGPPSILDDRTSLNVPPYETGLTACNTLVSNDRLADGQHVSAAQELRDGEKSKQPISPAESQLDGAVAETKIQRAQQEPSNEATWRQLPRAQEQPAFSREALVSPEPNLAPRLPSIFCKTGSWASDNTDPYFSIDPNALALPYVLQSPHATGTLQRLHRKRRPHAY